MNNGLRGAFHPLPYHGLVIVSSEEVPRGYRRTDGDTIFINPSTYNLIKPFGAKGILFALGLLSELGEGC